MNGVGQTYTNINLLTVCDKFDSRAEILKETAQKFGYNIKILGEEQSWISNTFRLKLVRDYLRSNTILNQIIILTDAFDVGILATPDEAYEKFISFDIDILFSAEANYAMWKKELRNYYWIYYPEKFEKAFPFLNAGMIMAKGPALLELLNFIDSKYELVLDDINSTKKIKSDQYILTRFYVDLCWGLIDFPYKVKLDTNQEILGCLGGRTSVMNWKFRNKKMEYRFFYRERRSLKAFTQSQYQCLVRGIQLSDDKKRIQFIETNTKPVFLHIPGSLTNFQSVWKNLFKIKEQQKPSQLAIIISIWVRLHAKYDLFWSKLFAKVYQTFNMSISPKIPLQKKDSDYLLDLFTRCNKSLVIASLRERQFILDVLPIFLHELKRHDFIIICPHNFVNLWILHGFHEKNIMTNFPENPENYKILMTLHVKNSIVGTIKGFYFLNLEKRMDTNSQVSYKIFPKEMPLAY